MIFYADEHNEKNDLNAVGQVGDNFLNESESKDFNNHPTSKTAPGTL